MAHPTAVQRLCHISRMLLVPRCLTRCCGALLPEGSIGLFLGYQGGRTPTSWPHTAIRRARLAGARGKASPARYA